MQILIIYSVISTKGRSFSPVEWTTVETWILWRWQ